MALQTYMYIIYIYVYHVSLALQTSLRAQEAFVNGQKQGVEWELEHVLRAKAQLQAQLQVCPYVSSYVSSYVSLYAQALCGIHRNNIEL